MTNRFLSIFHLINQIKRELKDRVDSRVYRDQKGSGAPQEVTVEMISMSDKKEKLVLMEDQENQAKKVYQDHLDMKVRGDKWVKWDHEAGLVTRQKDQEEIQE